MPRISLRFPKPVRLRYLDSLHAALIAGLRETGTAADALIGSTAAPWTFAAVGQAFPGGGLRLDGAWLSTPDPQLGEAMLRMDGGAARVRSSNGDVVDLSGTTVTAATVPLHPDQDQLTVTFASPFLVSLRGPSKSYARSLSGLDLSAAFSTGLTRRLGRQVALRVEADRLSAATEGAAPKLIRLRRTGSRDLILPALSAVLTLCGPPADLRDAFLAGLGEKTRYGFGCPVGLA